MAQVTDPSKNLVKLDNGQTVTAQTGGWYDGQQYWGGTLGAPGSFNSQNNQPGQQGSAYVAPENQSYIQKQQSNYKPPSNSLNLPSVPNPSLSPSSGAQTGGALTFSTTPTINLPDIYNNLYSSLGIADTEAKIKAIEERYQKAKAEITDNPFSNASMIDQRLKRLDDKYNAELIPLKNDVATKKADIETQINLQTKQYDINSTEAQTAMQRFETLLDAGALNNASTDDIANLTRLTGLSSSIIQSAIQNKIQSGYTTTTKTFDDGTNEGFIIYTLDNSGNIINQSKQVTGTSSTADYQYSSDASVSNFIKKILEKNGANSDITNLWSD